MNIKNKPNFTIKIKVNGKEVDRVETHSRRHFYNKIRTINWQNNDIFVYLRVNYGKRLSNKNKRENFWNDGEYTNEKDFFIAVKAFLES